MSIPTKCHTCGKGFVAPDSGAGMKAHCPHCGAVTVITADPAALVAAALSSAKGSEDSAAAALAAAARKATVTPADAMASLTPKSPLSPLAALERTPTPSGRSGGASSRTPTTASDRTLSRKSPYASLRLLAAIIFGVGVTLAALLFMTGLAILIVVSMGNRPVVGIGVFIGALVAAIIVALGARAISELLRMWADVGDRSRQMMMMLEDALDRARNETL